MFKVMQFFKNQSVMLRLLVVPLSNYLLSLSSVSTIQLVESDNSSGIRRWKKLIISLDPNW